MSRPPIKRQAARSRRTRRRRGRRLWPQHDIAVTCFIDDFEACIAHLRFPVTHRRAIRTTNLLERLFVEERRRLKIIPNAFGERAILKLMFGALIRAAERWKSIKVTESNAVSSRLSKRNLIRNTSLKFVSIVNLQRLHPAKYPAVLRLDPRRVHGLLISRQKSTILLASLLSA